MSTSLLAKLLALALTWLLVNLCEGHAEQHVRVSGGRRRVLRKSTHPATDTPGATVREVPLSHYDWHEVIDSMEGLLE